MDFIFPIGGSTYYFLIILWVSVFLCGHTLSVYGPCGAWKIKTLCDIS
jgi:hypothetical protein